jgi:hypothetical protein
MDNKDFNQDLNNLTIEDQTQDSQSKEENSKFNTRPNYVIISLKKMNVNMLKNANSPTDKTNLEF